jgi:hypothetical protein
MNFERQTMKKLDRIFYIYSEASVCVLMLAGAIIELACWAFLPAPINWLPAAAVVFFLAAAAQSALYIYRRESK